MHNPYKYLPSTLLRRTLCKLTLTIPSGGRKTLHIYNIHIRIHINKDFISTNTCGEVVFNHCPISKHIFLFFFPFDKKQFPKVCISKNASRENEGGEQKTAQRKYPSFLQVDFIRFMCLLSEVQSNYCFFFFFLLSARKFCF